MAHPDGDDSGPQTEKLTFPVGVPPVVLPVTAAESVVVSPSVIEVWAGVEVVVLLAWVTVKHSADEASDEVV